MKKITLFIFLIFNSIYAQENLKKDGIYVALSLDDCINCNLYWYEIKEKLNEPEITFILESEFKSDSVLVNRKTGIYDYKNSRIVYSDSLYKTYSNGIKSTVFITKNSEVLYTSDLYQLNTDEFITEYKKLTQNCFSEIKSGTIKIQDNESIIVSNTSLGRHTYYNKSGKSKDFISDMNWMKKAYKVYYGESDWKSHYDEINDVLKQLPNILFPEISYIQKDTSTTISFLLTIKFLEKEQKTNSINVISKVFLVNQDYEEDVFNSFKYINTELLHEKGYYLTPSFFIKKGNTYLFPINALKETNNESHYLCTFKINKNSNNLNLIDILPAKIPVNYIKYGFGHNFHDYIFKNNLIMLPFSEYIYDWEKNVKYSLLFSEDYYDKNLKDFYQSALAGEALNTYSISDIFESEKNIHILYTSENKELCEMIINKKDKSLSKVRVILNSNEFSQRKKKSAFKFKSENELIYIDENNCISYLLVNKKAPI